MSGRIEVQQRASPPPADRPLVSVIVPTRNRAPLLARSVMSVLGQSWRNLELIVVDDGSTDDTAAVLAAVDDPRLRVLRRQQGSSAAAARNAGIGAARGSYLAFNDDDDIWLPHKLERQMSALLAAPAGFGLCLCGRLLLAPGRAALISGAARAGELDFRRGNGRGGPDYALIATPSWVVRRSALEAVGGFDERLVTWEDWELALRLWQQYDVLVLDEPLYVQDQLAGGHLFRLERAKADALRVIEDKHGALWAHDRRVRARHQYVIGLALSLHEPRPAGRAELWHSLRLHPWSAKTLTALFLTCVPDAWSRRTASLLRRLRATIHRATVA
ncbi:glycosyltransferase family A protein [Fontimonas sp. SYSU GA230001]|uniref:glycosyltransferase family 2 protein n=1 Tax=Fontimonas sp. SYSU GA230001 TaxID=3142450 RepID=UPI0032B60A7F